MGSIEIDLVPITEDTTNGYTHATNSPADETVYQIALPDCWDEPTPRRIGNVLHELGHHESEPSRDGHGPRWYKQVQHLGGGVIHQLQDELDIL